MKLKLELWAAGLGILLLFGIFSLPLAAIYMSVFKGKSGKAEYCYIETSATNSSQIPGENNLRLYSLRGYVEWRVDTTIGVFKTFDEAVEAANKIKCPLRAE